MPLHALKYSCIMANVIQAAFPIIKYMYNHANFANWTTIGTVQDINYHH